MATVCEPVNRRSRKSAPVKNHTFVGTLHRNRNALKEDTQSERMELRSPRGRKRHSEVPFNDSRMRFSTPVRGCETEPRKLRSRDNDCDRSLSSLSTASSRRFHPKYDPVIELRRAKERYAKYNSRDWTDDLFLHEDTTKDLNNYEAKVRRRQSMSEEAEPANPVDLEKRVSELRRRQRDIDRGKITAKYEEYVFSVPKPEREAYHPQTPNKFRKVSRRAWDGMVKKWRKHLHDYENRDFSFSYRSDMSSMSSMSDTAFSLHEEDEEQLLDAENVPPAMIDSREVSLGDDGEWRSTTKMPRSRSRKPQVPTVPEIEDEDTLQGHDSAKPLRRSLRQRSGNAGGPAADVLHSGLTNDMAHFAPLKREAAAAEVAVTASPKKRAKREQGVVGILAEHGQHVLRSSSRTRGAAEKRS